ncbi:MAG: hypothetical protein J5J00_01180 [Deltaproteobacteria bacterium]|nr:hypothetical protein [Deltaproteobacteria bacterium]
MRHPADYVAGPEFGASRSAPSIADEGGSIKVPGLVSARAALQQHRVPIRDSAISSGIVREGRDSRKSSNALSEMPTGFKA